MDKETRLVVQWDYFRNADDKEPALQTPWKNWKRYRNILLSDDRGNRKMGDVAVFDELPEVIFKSLEPISIDSLIERNRK